MMPAAEPAMSWTSTVTCNAGELWRTCPDQEPVSAAGIIEVAAGAGDAGRADVLRLADAGRSTSLWPGWRVNMRVLAMAIAPTHATQAVTQPTRRAIGRAGSSSAALLGLVRGTPRAAARDRLAPSASRPAAGSLPPSSAVSTLRAAGRPPGSGTRQAAAVARNGSGRMSRSCGPTAGRPAAPKRIVCAHANTSADGVADPYGGVMLK